MKSTQVSDKQPQHPNKEAVNALNYLPDKEKLAVMEYIQALASFSKKHGAK
jgi:hypothetical protein